MNYLVILSLPITLAACAGVPLHDRVDSDTLPSSYIHTTIFDSEEGAVQHASQTYNDTSVRLDTEYLGAVLRSPSGRYTYTVSSGDPGDHRVSVRVPIPRGYEISAFWHTHGARRHTSRYFSDVDTRLANQTQRPVYMVSADNILRVYIPGMSTIPVTLSRKLRLGGVPGFARGVKVARQD